MSNQLVSFEGINAASEAAEFAANHGGEVVHEGVLFSVKYDDARTVAGFPVGHSNSTAAAIAAAKAREA